MVPDERPDALQVILRQDGPPGHRHRRPAASQVQVRPRRAPTDEEAEPLSGGVHCPVSHCRQRRVGITEHRRGRSDEHDAGSQVLTRGVLSTDFQPSPSWPDHQSRRTGAVEQQACCDGTPGRELACYAYHCPVINRDIDMGGETDQPRMLVNRS